jgi:Ser/Thr protein kinase RdoA (MazF antagonist)
MMDRVSGQEDLSAVVAHWDLGDVSTVSRTLLGTVNDTFIVTASRRLAVLRRHRTSELAVVLREHTLMDWARVRGIPCPALLPSRSGDPVVLGADDRLYSLFEHAPGRQVSRGELATGQVASLGRTLARIHDAISHATPVNQDSARRATENLPTPTETAAGIRHLLRTVESRPAMSERDRWAVQRLSSRLDWLDRHPDPAPAIASRERRPIHGDYQESNVFFGADDQVCAVIDWDQSEYGSCAGEVVRTMALSFGLDPSLCREFLDGYRTVRPLPWRDLDEEARIYGWRKLHDTWIYSTVYLDGDPRPSRFITAGSYVPFMDQWDDLRRRLGEAQP